MGKKGKDKIIASVDIPTEIYERILEVIQTNGWTKKGGIEKILQAGLISLKVDIAQEEIALLSSQINNLREETDRFTEENTRLKNLCNQALEDNEKLSSRIDELVLENENLEALLTKSDSLGELKECD